MDKIWDKKSFEIGGHWPLWWGWKNEWPRRTDKKSNAKNKMKYKISPKPHIPPQFVCDKWIWFHSFGNIVLLKMC